MSNSNHPLERHNAAKAKLEREIGPDFDSLRADELLRTAASNSFHNGKAIREIKIMVTVATAVMIAVAARVFGFI